MLGLLLYVVLVVLIGWLAIWVLGKLAPGHPWGSSTTSSGWWW